MVMDSVEKLEKLSGVKVSSFVFCACLFGFCLSSTATTFHALLEDSLFEKINSNITVGS